jgi:hypothetical protein
MRHLAILEKPFLRDYGDLGSLAETDFEAERFIHISAVT